MMADCSSNNGTIDWAKVKASGLVSDGIMIKVNEGYLCADTKATYNATQCHLLGLNIGYYHFATLNNPDVVADATQEANYFIASLSNLPEPTLPLALDIETNKINLPAPQVILWAKTFFKVLREAGKTNLALYSGLSFLSTEHFVSADFVGIKFWIAAYTNKVLKLPVGITDYWMHQYSDAGTIPGIKTNVDLSRANPLHLDT